MMNHRELCQDLAKAKNTIYTKFNIDILECKVNRSDMLKELRTEKWKGYLNYCNRFYFAVLSGIVDKNEIPQEAGLIVRGEKGWKVVKTAQKRDVEIPAETFMAMLFYKNKADKNIENRYYFTTGYETRKRLLKKVGKNVAKAINFYEGHQKESVLIRIYR